MNAIRSIREAIGLTQAALADALGMTQSNVAHYERGQTVPPKVAADLVAVAARHGLQITIGDVYADLEIPVAPPKALASEARDA